jgi:peptidyl-prolyl cis-trans isomerase D
LEQNKLTPSSFESGIHNDLLMDRILNALGAFTVIPAQLVRNWIEYIDQEIKVAYAKVKSEDFIAQVTVTNEALAAWYETAKDNYKTPPQSKLHYLAFDFNDDLKEVAVSDEAVRTYYQQHADTFNIL